MGEVKGEDLVFCRTLCNPFAGSREACECCNESEMVGPCAPVIEPAVVTEAVDAAAGHCKGAAIRSSSPPRRRIGRCEGGGCD